MKELKVIEYRKTKNILLERSFSISIGNLSFLLERLGWKRGYLPIGPWKGGMVRSSRLWPARQSFWAAWICLALFARFHFCSFMIVTMSSSRFRAVSLTMLSIYFRHSTKLASQCLRTMVQHRCYPHLHSFFHLDLDFSLLLLNIVFQTSQSMYVSKSNELRSNRHTIVNDRFLKAAYRFNNKPVVFWAYETNNEKIIYLISRRYSKVNI